MKIILVSTEPGWRGGEAQARLLLLGLRRRGHDCLVVAQGGQPFAQRMRDEQFFVEEISGKGLGPAPLWRMRKLIRRVQPDIVHMNDAHAIRCAGLASAGLIVGAKTAARRVDFPIRSPRIYNHVCDRVICVSAGVARVCADGGIAREKLVVVHDGADRGRAVSGDRQRGRKSLGIQPQQPLLLCVAALTDHKGHRFLLDGLPQVFDRHPDLVVGLAGDGELDQPLRQQARKLGIGDRVRFLGYRNDVPDLLAAADLFVMPSHLEGLCSTLIDVMLAGCPIVATGAGGIPELVGPLPDDDQAVASLVPPRQPGALADAIIDLLNDQRRRDRLVERGRRRAEARFTDDHMVENTIRAFRQAIGAASETIGRPANSLGGPIDPVGPGNDPPGDAERSSRAA